MKQFQKVFLVFSSVFAQPELLWDVNSIDISFSEGSSSVLDSSFARKWNFLFSSRWLSLRLNLETDFEVNRVEWQVFIRVFEFTTQTVIWEKCFRRNVWWRRLEGGKVRLEKAFLRWTWRFRTRFLLILKAARGVGGTRERLSTEMPWQHPDARLNWVTTRQFPFSNQFASGICSRLVTATIWVAILTSFTASFRHHLPEMFSANPPNPSQQNCGEKDWIRRD